MSGISFLKNQFYFLSGNECVEVVQILSIGQNNKIGTILICSKMLSISMSFINELHSENIR